MEWNGSNDGPLSPKKKLHCKAKGSATSLEEKVKDVRNDLKHAKDISARNLLASCSVGSLSSDDGDDDNSSLNEDEEVMIIEEEVTDYVSEAEEDDVVEEEYYDEEVVEETDSDDSTLEPLPPPIVIPKALQVKEEREERNDDEDDDDDDDDDDLTDQRSVVPKKVVPKTVVAVISSPRTATVTPEPKTPKASGTRRSVGVVNNIVLPPSSGLNDVEQAPMAAAVVQVTLASTEKLPRTPSPATKQPQSVERVKDQPKTPTPSAPSTVVSAASFVTPTKQSTPLPIFAATDNDNNNDTANDNDDDRPNVAWTKPDWTKNTKLRSTGKSAAGNLAKPITNLPHLKSEQQGRSFVAEASTTETDISAAAAVAPAPAAAVVATPTAVAAAPVASCQTPTAVRKATVSVASAPKSAPHTRKAAVPTTRSNDNSNNNDAPLTSIGWEKPDWATKKVLRATSKTELIQSGQKLERPIGGIKPVD